MCLGVSPGGFYIDVGVRGALSGVDEVGGQGGRIPKEQHRCRFDFFSPPLTSFQPLKPSGLRRFCLEKEF